MRPYEFEFIPGEGRSRDAGAYLLLDLDKLAAMGKPYFDLEDGIAYLTLNFAGSRSDTTVRALTGFKAKNRPGDGELIRDKAFMQAEADRFSQEVEKLRAAWIER